MPFSDSAGLKLDGDNGWCKLRDWALDQTVQDALPSGWGSDGVKMRLSAIHQLLAHKRDADLNAMKLGDAYKMVFNKLANGNQTKICPVMARVAELMESHLEDTWEEVFGTFVRFSFGFEKGDATIRPSDDYRSICGTPGPTTLKTIVVHFGTPAKTLTVNAADLRRISKKNANMLFEEFKSEMPQVNDVELDMLIQNVPTATGETVTTSMKCRYRVDYQGPHIYCEDPCTISLSFYLHRHEQGGFTERWCAIDKILSSADADKCTKFRDKQFEMKQMDALAVGLCEHAGYSHQELYDSATFPCGHTRTQVTP